MTSFQRLLEAMSHHHGSEHPADAQAMDAIRTGMNIRPDFWEDFLMVVNNSDGLSALLDVPTSTIMGWHHTVRKVLEKVKQHDAVPDPKKKGKLLHADEDPFGTA